MSKAFFKINLNKASNRLDQFEQKQKQKKVMALFFYFLIILVIAALAIFKSYQTQQVINRHQAELDRIEDEISRLESSADYLSPEDIFALAELATKRITWTEKLDVLGRILPRDVTITEINYDYKINTMMIKGVSRVKAGTKDLDLVVGIIDVIKNNENFAKDFADIKFSSSTRIRYQGQDIIEFEIGCVVG
jgi:Tfp pilus assembly protein PilN